MKKLASLCSFRWKLCQLSYIVKLKLIVPYFCGHNSEFQEKRRFYRGRRGFILTAAGITIMDHPQLPQKPNWVQIKKVIVKILTILFLWPIFLYPVLIVIITLSGTVAFIIEKIVGVLKIGDGASFYLQFIPYAVAFALVASLLASLWRGGVSKDSLVKKVSVASVETRHLHNGVPFGRMNDEWESFKSKMRKGDEIWYWSTPEWTWKRLAGRCGYVIVRNGKPTRHSILTGMN